MAPDKVTVADFVEARINQWEASGNVTARTAARYRELLKNQIAPTLGAKHLEKLRPLDIEEWHTTLRNSGRADGKGGIAPRTIGHAHRVLSSAISDAAENELVVKNVVKTKSAPKVPDEEMVIVKDVPGLVAKLDRLRTPAMVALFTGMRLGEVSHFVGRVWISIRRSSRFARRWRRRRSTAFASRHRSPRPVAATSPCRYSGRCVARTSQGSTRTAHEARRRKAPGRRSSLFGSRRCPTLDNIHEQGMGKVCRQHRNARSNLPCAAAYSRQPVDRCGCRYRHDQQAPRPRQARHHAAGSMLTCSARMTARRRLQSMRSWGTDGLCPNLCPRHRLFFCEN